MAWMKLMIKAARVSRRGDRQVVAETSDGVGTAAPSIAPHAREVEREVASKLYIISQMLRLDTRADWRIMGM